jgi:hypothetical protein
MNKQEIIDNLRLEISERDMLLIDMQAKIRMAAELLRRVSITHENMNIIHGRVVDSVFCEEIENAISELSA